MKVSELPQAWPSFVRDVRKGKIIDPVGQYVRDGEYFQVPEDNGQRPTRPKTSLVARVHGQQNTNSFTTNDDPDCKYCFEQPCNGCGGAPPTPTFFSSVNLGTYSGPGNVAGDILDLKIAKGWSDVEAYAEILDGYEIIPINLNYGAGGQNIYLTFTRVPNKVQLGDEKNRTDRVVEGSVRRIFVYSDNGNVAPVPRFAVPNFVPIQSPGSIFNEWKFPDLNDGAYGKYIYAYTTKEPREGLPIEVGILRGNNSAITPPMGWRKIDGDLNEGAGGDYIYFCVKDR